MRRILRRREVVEDDWRVLGEEGAEESPPLGVPSLTARSPLGTSPLPAGDVTATAAPVPRLQSAGPALIVPFAEFRTDTAKWRAYAGRLGVRLSPVDAVEDLAEDIQRLSLVAAEFPTPGEGRGYTQGRLLRSRLQFKGELRAVGAAVKQDLLFILSRCGFDSFELAAGQKIEEASRALDRYSVAYQPAEPVPSIRQQRYRAAG